MYVKSGQDSVHGRSLASETLRSSPKMAPDMPYLVLCRSHCLRPWRMRACTDTMRRCPRGTNVLCSTHRRPGNLNSLHIPPADGMHAGVCRTDCILNTSGRCMGPSMLTPSSNRVEPWRLQTIVLSPMGEGPSVLQRTPLIVLPFRDHVRHPICSIKYRCSRHRLAI